MKKNTYILCLYLFLLSTLSVYSQTPQISWWYDIKDDAFGNSAMADFDMDGKPEIVFSDYRNDSCVYVLNAEDGSLLWKYNTGGCNDVAPLIYDVDGDGMFDFVVATWSFIDSNKIYAYRAHDQQLLWGNSMPQDYIYHGVSYADLDDEGKPELVIGSYNGTLHVLNGEDGSLFWKHEYPYGYTYFTSGLE